MIASKPRAILLMGPTASGKTALAMNVFRRFPIELISVDSAQVFRDMNIGTSKPDAVTLKEFPHHLIDLISPEEVYSAANFREDALSLMDHITVRGKTPFLVGGTMLYFKALLEGLANLPSANLEVRAKIEALAMSEGWSAVYAALAKVDPETAGKLKATDAQRVSRALEVFYLTGLPISELVQRSQHRKAPYTFLKLGLLPSDRSMLHERIAKRFDAMLAAGFEDEVAYLRKTYHLSPNSPSMRCVGYRQILKVQDGLIPRHEMRDQGIYATRQLAKRQITWLTNTLKAENFDCLSLNLETKIYTKIEQFLG